MTRDSQLTSSVLYAILCADGSETELRPKETPTGWYNIREAYGTKTKGERKMNDERDDAERTARFLNRTVTVGKAIAEAVALTAAAAAWVAVCCL